MSAFNVVRGVNYLDRKAADGPGKAINEYSTMNSDGKPRETSGGQNENNNSVLLGYWSLGA